MKKKAEDFHDKDLRASFTFAEVTYSPDGDSYSTKLILGEVTDIRGDIVEIRVAPSKYLMIDKAVLQKAIVNFNVDHER